MACRLDPTTADRDLLYARALARHAACKYDIEAYDSALADATEATGRFEQSVAGSSGQPEVGLAGARAIYEATANGLLLLEYELVGPAPVAEYEGVAAFV